ncbi:Fc receptor-like protein 5 [Colossoma macropomum]|uniref:Fc receptor-like protein 5 n=1 Tax=Colossoma macropomum TaxID=42526 RepID=UPI0018653875|nr:Fc receptor-like protein 5 [Colossoma macropomum]
MEFRSLSVILLLVSLVQAGHAQGQYKPVLTVQPDWPQIFSGENVTLTCSIPGGSVADWTYNWYRDYVLHSSDENYYIIRDIKRHHSLKYSCYGWGKRGQGVSPSSNEVTLTVTERPKPSLILVPTGQMFTGEKVTLRCDIQGHTDTEWRYSWYKDGDSNHPVYSSDWKREYSFSVAESDSGKYTCRGERRSDSQRSEISDAVTLTVSEKPKPELTSSHKGAALIGNPVVLYCELDQSAGWRFYWFKHTQNPENKTKTETHSYSISSVSVSDGGQYWCRAGRGTPVYYTHYSDALWIKVTGDPKAAVSIKSDEVFIGQTCSLTKAKLMFNYLFPVTDLLQDSVSPPVSLMVSPSRTQHFITDSLSLSCEGQSDSTGWGVRRYTHSEKVSDCSSGWGSVTGSTCSISSLSTSHTGVYWCESESGESSNPVNITVHNNNVILDSPVHPVTEGDPLTVRCLYHPTKPSNLTAEFYKDGLFLQTQTTGEMTIHTVSKSDEGLYHCKHPEKGESPQSWISVREGRTSFSVFSLLSSLMAVSPYLLASIVLGVKCYRARAQIDEDQSQYAVTEE